MFDDFVASTQSVRLAPRVKRLVGVYMGPQLSI